MTHPSRLLRELEGRARKRFGQHFLASPDVVARIVAAGEVASGDRVLEIGPGLGVMTEALLGAGAEVTAVELDRDLAAFLRERHPGLRLIEADAAATDWDATLPGSGWKCISNLPYNVGTRLVADLVTRRRTFERLVVMLQREVAERMLAPAGSRDRGSLSAHVQAYAEVSLALRVKPGAFYPPPKVDSAVIDLRLRAEPLLGGAAPEAFERAVRAAFCAPRKSLRNALSSAWGRERAEAALAAAGLDGGVRASVLTGEDLGRLALANENAGTGP